MRLGGGGLRCWLWMGYWRRSGVGWRAREAGIDSAMLKSPPAINQGPMPFSEKAAFPSNSSRTPLPSHPPQTPRNQAPVPFSETALFLSSSHIPPPSQQPKTPRPPTSPSSHPPSNQHATPPPHPTSPTPPSPTPPTAFSPSPKSQNPPPSTRKRGPPRTHGFMAVVRCGLCRMIRRGAGWWRIRFRGRR